MKLIPRIHKNIIHVVRSKFHGSMLSLLFNFCYAVIYLQIEVGPIIIWLVVDVVACLDDKWGDLVGLQNMCGPIIEVAVMAVKEEYLGVDIARSTGPTEETRYLNPAIPVHIS